jgi:hypothetical protein
MKYFLVDHSDNRQEYDEPSNTYRKCQLNIMINIGVSDFIAYFTLPLYKSLKFFRIEVSYAVHIVQVFAARVNHDS